MDVYLASPRGFCAGVVRAVDIVELALAKFGPPVYVKHQIVHNPHVVADLEAKGARTIEHVEDIPHGAVVVFSAHGSPPSDYDAARKQNLHVIDATCPLVTRVHNEAKKYAREGKQVILVGHRGHQEVIGTTGQAPMTLLDEREEFPSDGWKQGVEVVVLTQTTLSVRDTAKAVSEIQKRYPAAIVRNDICYATTNRQEAAQELAKLTQIVLVIGAQNSSNCNRLREVAIAEGVPAYLINGPDEMNMEWFKGVKRVGITSGASTPEKLVQEVVTALGPASVIHIGGGEENITFTLPRELRDNQKPANTVSGD